MRISVFSFLKSTKIKPKKHYKVLIFIDIVGNILQQKFKMKKDGCKYVIYYCSFNNQNAI
jgi:hypothetical protein